MTARHVLALAVVGFYVVAVGVGVLIEVAGGGRSTEVAEGLIFIAAFGLFAVLGAVLIARRPGHVMGPLFATVGLLPAIGFPGETYAALRVLDGGAVPLWARLLAWPNTFYWYVVLAVVVVFVPLLFPDGHLPSPRWRWVAWLVGAGLVVICMISAVSERIGLQTVGPRGEDLSVVNPFGIAGMPYGEDNPLFDPVGSVVVVGAGAAVVAVVVRFRRSRGAERQQFKWFLLPVSMIAVSLVSDVVPVPLPAWGPAVLDGVNLVGFVGLPVAITLAILRFRLYEIDRIISRTVTYAIVTATLLAAYAAIVTLPGAVFALRSDLLVAGATLLAAAVFVPVRRRVQAVVDRRFNRSRYDAQRVVDRFGVHLRAEIDLDCLTVDLRRVVASTVQPASVSLWLAQDDA